MMEKRQADFLLDGDRVVLGGAWWSVTITDERTTLVRQENTRSHQDSSFNLPDWTGARWREDDDA